LNKRIIGKYAEEKAIDFLIQNKYKILAKNYSNKLGEIDVIAQDKNDLVFIEVKYRTNFLYSKPEFSVNYKKQQKLIKLALTYIKEKNIKNKNVRFDVISITPQGLNLIKNAFVSNYLSLY